jgi:transcriptional regulator with XRE-family HTH domain
MLLRRHRTAAGLTQVSLAERSGYYVNYLRKVERGERRPSQHVTAALAEALQLSAADRALFERVARHGVMPQPSLVGREDEMAALEAHLDGNGRRMLILSGEPGIGKTRLLAEARRLAGERGMLTLEATCRSETPFAPIREALERPLWAMPPEERIRSLAGCERLSRLIAESIGVTFQLRPVLSPEEEQEQVFEAVSRFLTRLAAGRAIVLLLDDAHLVDGDTLDLLGRLLWLSELPFFVVCACRDTYPDHCHVLDAALEEAPGAGMAHRVPLGPLAPAHAGILLDELLGDAATPEQRQRLIDRAGGIPSLLLSLAAGPLDGPVATEIAEGILARVDSLPECAQEALRIVALAAGTAPKGLIAQVSGHPPVVVEAGLATACAADLLVTPDGDTYTCRCEIVREVVAATASPAVKIPLGQRIVDARTQLRGDTCVQSSPLVTSWAMAASPERPARITRVPAEDWCVGQ